MKIRHDEIDIPKEQPFNNCELGRKQHGIILTDLVKIYPDGFVLSIDSKWGTGKTTFVKMWKQHLENEKYKTLYFNAWINDFDSNPLVAILSELKTLDTKVDNPTFKSLLSKGAVIATGILPTIAKAIAKKYLDTDVVIESIEKLTESAVDILKDEVNEYAKKKKGLDDFKKELEDYVKNHSEGKPIIFIIDELDRCRPNYAVEVLEQVKHFFSVKGIVFVLAIDKMQLGNAVKGFYNSESINSNEYLRRIIDLEYILPEPPIEKFCEYMYNYYQFKDFFFSEDRKHEREFRGDKDSFLKIAILLFSVDGTSLRQQEKIFAHARVALNTVPLTSYLFPDLYFLLVYIRDLHKDYYLQIRDKKLSAQKLIDGLKTIFPQNIDTWEKTSFINLEARFALFYDNYAKEEYGDSSLFEKDATSGEYITKIKSSYNTEDANSNLVSRITAFGRDRLRDIKISLVLNRIDLLAEFVK